MSSTTKRLARNRKDSLAWILVWLNKARQELSRNPRDLDWFESLSECVLGLEELAGDGIDELPSIGLALVNAKEDLAVRLIPDWMRPALVPASRRPPSSRERRIRGTVVDCVRYLQEIPGYNERRACREVAERLPFEIRVSEEVVRAWVRSGQYERYISIIEDGKIPEPPTAVGLLDALVRACQRASRYPAAQPKTSK